MAEQHAKEQPLTLLGGLSAEAFLRDYWQKKPLLIRQAIPDFTCPVAADELAGLSLEDEVESRLIVEHDNWALRHGPFKSRDFKQLPATHWTLLIQQLDAWSPEINALKQLFRFIPNWRVDDVMASYAPEGGSVGPHFDDYDVFLLQAEGQRSWKIGQYCDTSSRLQAHSALRLLAEFETQEEWVLEPGDMLYLPPKLAHHGIARNDCITLSIGFRAPAKSQLLNMYADYVMDTPALSQRYADPDLSFQTNPGEITNAALDRLQAMLTETLSDRDALSHCFGLWSTEPKNPQTLSPPDEEYDRDWLINALQDDSILNTNEGSRFAYTQSGDSLTLFADGRDYNLSTKDSEFVQKLCAMDAFSVCECLAGDPDSKPAQVVLALLNQGSLYCVDDDQ